jgi:hypothetical protein
MTRPTVESGCIIAAGGKYRKKGARGLLGKLWRQLYRNKKYGRAASPPRYFIWGKTFIEKTFFEYGFSNGVDNNIGK